MEEKNKIPSLEEHKRLASVVKNIHADLRKKLRASNGDFEAVWTQHCQDQSVLSVYAESMKALALDHWTKNSHTRIDWCRDAINEYFHCGGLKKALEREAKQRDRLLRKTMTCKRQVPVPESSEDTVANTGGGNSGKVDEAEKATETCHGLALAKAKDKKGHTNLKPQGNDPNFFQDDEEKTGSSMYEESFEQYTRVQLPFEGKVRLLDVGSCYNPFQQFEEMLAVGVDLSPATESVRRCDFLRLRTTPPLVQRLQQCSESVDRELLALTSPVDTLPASAFHVVVFCLLLEYLPAPDQRWQCCVKARQLLQQDGLLIIITPDSKSQHRNAPMIRSWKTAIESLGFCPWKYVKLEHLHCMAFRKTSSPSAHSSSHLHHHQQGSLHHADSGIQRHENDCDLSSQLPQLNTPSCGDGSCAFPADDAFSYAGMMYIPQDFHDVDDEEEERKEEFLGPEDRFAFCSAADSELPGFGLDDSEED